MGSQDLFKPGMDVRSDHYSTSIPFNFWDLFLNGSSPEKLHQTAIAGFCSVKICQDDFHAVADPKDLQELPKMTSHPLIQIIQIIQMIQIIQ